MNNKNKGNRILMLLIIGWGGGVYCGATSASTMFLYI